MGSGTGVALIAAGLVFSWGPDLHLPYVAEHALGALFLVAGVVVLVASAVMRAQRAGTGPEAGLLMILLGASLLWAVKVDVPFVHDAALGVILLLGGIATVAVAVAANRPRTMRRQVVYRSSFRSS